MQCGWLAAGSSWRACRLRRFRERYARPPLPRLQALEEAHGTIAEEAGRARALLDDAEAATVGRLEQYRERYLPAVRKYDSM